MNTRDREKEAINDFSSHIGTKILTLLRNPKYQQHIQSIVDPVVNHIINRVFPYIVFGCIVFLILILISVATFLFVIKSSYAHKNTNIIPMNH